MNRRFLTWLLLVFIFITLLLQTFDNTVPQQDEMKRAIDDVGINEIRRRRKEDAVQLIHGGELAESTDPDRNEIHFHSRKGGRGRGGGGRGMNIAHHHNNSPPKNQRNQANAVFFFSYRCSMAAAITVTVLLFIFI
ncbi:hypothetical protein Dimus_027896 [Dionaea muscipula]